MQVDACGVLVGATSDDARASCEAALRAFLTGMADATTVLDAAVYADPQSVGGHLMRALAFAIRGERRWLAEARVSLAAVAGLSHLTSERERLLVRAVGQLLEPDWRRASRTLDRVLVAHPRDLFVLRCAHVIDGLRGDVSNLRNRIARVLPHWPPETPGYAHVLGMYAWGLAAAGDHARAEACARSALALEPREPSAMLAVAPALRAQGRSDEAMRWLEAEVRRGDAPAGGALWSHLAWQLAAFRLDEAHCDAALDLYDAIILPRAAQGATVLVDASALLWRLHIAGVDVGRRSGMLSDAWETGLAAEAGYRAFNDVHAAMAFCACGRSGALSTLKQAMRTTAGGSGETAAVMREVGLPLVDAVDAFAAGQYAIAVDAIESVREDAWRLGGTDLQRDVMTLTLIEAARRLGDRRLALHYLAERNSLRSPVELAGGCLHVPPSRSR